MIILSYRIMEYVILSVMFSRPRAPRAEKDLHAEARTGSRAPGRPEPPTLAPTRSAHCPVGGGDMHCYYVLA